MSRPSPRSTTGFVAWARSRASAARRGWSAPGVVGLPPHAVVRPLAGDRGGRGCCTYERVGTERRTPAARAAPAADRAIGRRDERAADHDRRARRLRQDDAPVRLGRRGRAPLRLGDARCRAQRSRVPREIAARWHCRASSPTAPSSSSTTCTCCGRPRRRPRSPRSSRTARPGSPWPSRRVPPRRCPSPGSGPRTASWSSGRPSWPWTCDETAQLLRLAGLDLDAAECVELWSRTEGWPAAVALGALAIGDSCRARGVRWRRPRGRRLPARRGPPRPAGRRQATAARDRDPRHAVGRALRPRPGARGLGRGVVGDRARAAPPRPPRQERRAIPAPPADGRHARGRAPARRPGAGGRPPSPRLRVVRPSR